MATVHLSSSDLAALSAPARDEILRLLSLAPDVPLSADEDLSGDPVSLNVTQARRVLAGISDRPRVALRWISEFPAPTFSYDQFAAAIGRDDTGGIRGVTAAITRRTRTVTGIVGAILLEWIATPNGGGIFRVSPTTQASLRQAFAPANNNEA
jgi:hypothetical protein